MKNLEDTDRLLEVLLEQATFMSFWWFSSSQVSTNSFCAIQCKTKKSNKYDCEHVL